jgi:hypothetical protein
MSPAQNPLTESAPSALKGRSRDWNKVAGNRHMIFLRWNVNVFLDEVTIFLKKLVAPGKVKRLPKRVFQRLVPLLTSPWKGIMDESIY